MNVRELTEGLEIDIVLLVRERAQERVTLADRTASLSAVVPPELVELCEPGTCVRVCGRIERGRLHVQALRHARTDEYVLEDLLDGPRIDLTPVKQAGGKIVTAFAVRADLDLAGTHSNTFELEWPRGSGHLRSFPEVDRVEWYPVAQARVKLLKGQVPLLDELMADPGLADLHEG